MQMPKMLVSFNSEKQNAATFLGPKKSSIARVSKAVPSWQWRTALRPVGSRTGQHGFFVAASSKARLMPLQCGTTSLTIPITDEGVKSMAVAFNKLLSIFAEKQNSQGLVRWDVFEFKTTDNLVKGNLNVELFCNPNAHSTAFDAQVLVTLTGSEGFKVVGEASLEQVRSSIATLLQSMRQETM